MTLRAMDAPSSLLSVSTSATPVRRYLVVANRTLASMEVKQAILQRSQDGPCQFRVVVPATRQEERLTWTLGAAWAVARRRLDDALNALADLGVDATGEVGDENPVLAVLDALLAEPADEVILCTLPDGLSRWVRLDVTKRLRRRLTIPVAHIETGRRPAKPSRPIEVAAVA